MTNLELEKSQNLLELTRTYITFFLFWSPETDTQVLFKWNVFKQHTITVANLQLVAEQGRNMLLN